MKSGQDDDHVAGQTGDRPGFQSGAAIEVLPRPDEVAEAAAERVVAAAAAATSRAESGGRFTIALSGGSTPRALYTLLAKPPRVGRIDWQRVHLFWGDERCLPPGDPGTNFHMTRETLLDRVPLPAGNIHRIRGEIAPEEAARAYEAELRGHFAEGRTGGGFPGASADDRPRFDLVLLGMGADGHTASLFPGSRALDEGQRWACAEYVPSVSLWRVTLTAPVLNAAAAVLFLVTGQDKAPALKQVLSGPRRPHTFPAQMIVPERGTVTWLVDEAAASELSRPVVAAR